jgi:hypothetical protein
VGRKFEEFRTRFESWPNGRIEVDITGFSGRDRIQLIGQIVQKIADDQRPGVGVDYKMDTKTFQVDHGPTSQAGIFGSQVK